MEPLALATVMTDGSGLVTAASGEVSGVAFTADLAGKPWATAFAEWNMPCLPDAPSAYPCRLRARSPSGEAVSVELIRLPGGDHRTLAVFRSDESVALPPRMQELCGIGEIACGVSHEIKNALTPVCGYLDLWRELGVDNLPKFDLVQKEARRVAELTHNLQDVARGRSDEPHDLDLAMLLSEVTSLVGHEMEKSEITLESQIAADLPRVDGSTGRLKQALINLLVNARHATPPGGRVTLVACQVNNHVELSVQDTGCGIAPELHARVFHNFFTTKPEGTGLGLPITKKIVEDHGGTIHLESAPGQGARFTIKLPVRPTP